MFQKRSPLDVLRSENVNETPAQREARVYRESYREYILMKEQEYTEYLLMGGTIHMHPMAGE